jgi:uncharacterized C2H2 Zn-finger protein
MNMYSLILGLQLEPQSNRLAGTNAQADGAIPKLMKVDLSLDDDVLSAATTLLSMNLPNYETTAFSTLAGPQAAQLRRSKRSTSMKNKHYTTPSSQSPILHPFNPNSAEVARRTRACPICGVSFSRGEHAERHVRGMHFGEKHDRCPRCGTFFARKDNMLAHKRSACH